MEENAEEGLVGEILETELVAEAEDTTVAEKMDVVVTEVAELMELAWTVEASLVEAMVQGAWGANWGACLEEGCLATAMAAESTVEAQSGEVCEAAATEVDVEGDWATVKGAVFQEEEARADRPGAAEKETEAVCWEAVAVD